MELSFLMKVRIAAAAAVGVVLIGILAWPLVAPVEALGAVLAGNMDFGDKIILAGLAILAGFATYFLSWPYGREIGILAVPAGLAVWAVRSCTVASLIQQSPALAQRQQFFAALKWEGLFWLAIVAAGFLGVLLAQRISSQRAKPYECPKKSGSKANVYMNTAIALIGSILMVQLCIKVFAQDVKLFDNKLGTVVAQPATGQIVFALLVSFGIVAFVVKKFLNVSYIWPTIASSLVTAFAGAAYIKHDVLLHLVQNWPAVFSPSPVLSILPVQMVTFGALGSIAGYWIAIRYDYWREHEMDG